MTNAGVHFRQADAALERSEWATAAAALEAGIEADPAAPPKKYYQLGLSREHLDDWQGAVEAIEEAISRRKEPLAWWYFKLGRGLRRLRRFEDAAEAYELAIRHNPDAPLGWYLQLGNTLEQQGAWTRAQEWYGQVLDRDPETRPVERRMLATESQEFSTRRAVVRFVEDHLDEIRSVAAESLRADDRTEVIYSYWAQGFDQAPEIVRRCHQRLLERSTGTVLALDDPAMSRLISLPADIEARGIHPTHRSDLLRLELLARHGGSWLDATCLVLTDPAPELAALRAPSGWFAFAKRRTSIATWLMSSVPDHYLVRTLRAGLHTYWRHHDQLTHYYVLHHIFEALSVLDDRFGALWAATPVRHFDEPFRLRWNFGQPYQEQTFQPMLAGSFVHKLTYKFGPGETAPDTVLGHLLSIM